jgi:hypothetical protein
MSEGYAAVAETDDVRAAQVRLGSRRARARSTPEPRDPLTGFERAFVARVCPDFG